MAGLGSMSIRTKLVASFSTLLVALIVFLIDAAVEASRTRADAGKLLHDNEISLALLEAMGHWAFERGSSHTVLGASEEQARRLRPIIEEKRFAGDAAFDRAVALIEDAAWLETDMPDLVEARRAHRSVVARRREVDAALERSVDEREPALFAAVVPTYAKLIEACGELRRSLWRDAPADEIARKLGFMIESAWIMSEYAGRERAIIGNHIAGAHALEPDDLAILQAYRGRLVGVWGFLENEAAGDTVPGLADVVEKADQAFFTRFESVRDAVFGAGRSGEPYPIDAATWVAASTRGIDSILSIQDLLGKVVTDHLSTRERAADQTLMIDSGALILAGLLGVYLFSMVTRGVIGPIRGMTRAMIALAEGDTTVEVPGSARRDEIGDMAGAVDVFKANAIEKDRLEREQRETAERMAEEKAAREARAREEKRRTTEQMATRFESTVGSVLETLIVVGTDLEAAAELMVEKSEQAKTGSSSIAGSSEQSAANVENISSAVEELWATVEEIGKQVATAAEITDKAIQRVSEAGARVESLVETTEEITSVLGVIGSIAAQTNLLALNAQIEAASAGEAGKGFEVVAGEIKNLAAKTTQSTKSIEDQIQVMRESSRLAVEGMSGIGAIMNELGSVTASLSTGVEQQGGATREIATNLQEASKANSEVSRAVNEVNGSVLATDQATEQVMTLATSVSGNTRELETEVEVFLEGVRLSA